MSEGRIDLLTRLPIASIEKVRADALLSEDMALHVDAARALQLKSRMQTPELESSGRLFEHVEPPSPTNGGRFITRYTGDNAAWMKPFMRGPTSFTVNRRPDVVARETVDLRAGERAVVVRADGTMRT